MAVKALQQAGQAAPDGPKAHNTDPFSGELAASDGTPLPAAHSAIALHHVPADGQHHAEGHFGHSKAVGTRSIRYDDVPPARCVQVNIIYAHTVFRDNLEAFAVGQHFIVNDVGSHNYPFHILNEGNHLLFIQRTAARVGDHLKARIFEDLKRSIGDLSKGASCY